MGGIPARVNDEFWLVSNRNSGCADNSGVPFARHCKMYVGIACWEARSCNNESRLEMNVVCKVVHERPFSTSTFEHMCN